MQDEMKEMKQTLELHSDQLATIKSTLYGNKETGAIGMNDKLDSIYEILIQAKGIKGMFNMILLFAAVIAVFKGWVLGK